MRRLAPAVLALAAVAAAIVVVVVELSGDGNPSTLRPRPLAASASLAPAHILFGDPVTASVEVVADRRVDRGSIRLEPDLGPYRIESSSRRTSSAGGLTRVEQRYVLSCLTAACLPGGRPPAGQPTRSVQPGAVRVLYRIGGAPGSVTLPLPAVEITSRLSAAARTSPRRALDAPVEAPPVSYAVAPGSLSIALVALAGFLLAVALLLALLTLRRALRRRRVRRDDRTALARALAAVRTAAGNGDAPGLRRDLGWLARELREVGRDETADDALELAWSTGPPRREAIARLARSVEEAVDDGR